MEPATGIVGSILTFLKSGWKIMLAVWGMCLFFLLIPSLGLLSARWNAVADVYFELFAVGFILSSFYFVAEFVEWSRTRSRNYNAVTGKRQQLEKKIGGLNKKELALLREFIRRDQRTIEFPDGASELQTLIDRKLVKALYGSPSGTVCTIADEVWDYLHEIEQRRK